MEGIELIRESRQKAAEEYKAYKAALSTRMDNVNAEVETAYRDLMSVYGHMRHGRALIDIRQAIGDAGFDEDGWPRLAIARADYRQCFCMRNSRGRVLFSGLRARMNWGSVTLSVRKEDIDLRDIQADNRPSNVIQARTSAPFIPPKLLPEDSVENYYLLWEAEGWEITRIIRPPRDPMLLSRVNDTIFVVLATWEMTDLERTVLAGRIA